MSPQADDDQIEGQPVEGTGEVSPEGLLVQAGEARHVGERKASLHGKDDAEEFLEEVSLSLAEIDVENDVHLYEDESKRGRKHRLCWHGS